MASHSDIGGFGQNTPVTMPSWLIDPPSVDPTTTMPNVHVSRENAGDSTSFWFTLQ